MDSLLFFQALKKELLSLLGDEDVPKRVLFEKLEAKYGISRAHFEQIVHDLMTHGYVYESRRDFLARS